MDYQIWDLPKNEITAICLFQEFKILHKDRMCIRNHVMKLMSHDCEPFWVCNRAVCRKKIGLRKNTWFTKSRITFLKSVRFIYFWCQESTSLEFCELQLNINHNTTVDWNNYMREVCANNLLLRQKLKIGGSGKIVEIDESLFTRRKNHAGRVLPTQWVFGGLCRETKECFLVAVPDRTAQTLFSAIEEYIADGTTIYSDCWKGYRTQELEDAGYDHFTVNHSYNFVDPVTHCHTQSIERLWGSAKWRNKRQRGTSRHHLDSYLIEFMWRCLHPKTRLFTAILKAISNFMPPE